MKTQVIQLNKNDDVISIRDKMSWSQTGRILLVWPGKDQDINRRLEINLVKRHAEMLGAQLAFVTRNPEIRFHAHSLGIPVFNNIRQAQQAHWRRDNRKNSLITHEWNHPSIETMQKLLHQQNHEWMNRPAIRLFCFTISVIALFLLGIYILPGAKVMLTPQLSDQSITLSLYADPSLTAINLSAGGLPSYNQEVIVEGVENAIATGSVTIPDQVAAGKLLFSNISDQEITIPRGTVVSTFGNDRIRFITLSNDEVNVKPGETITLNARSVKPGSSGNLPANTLVAIEGDLGPDITVTNPYATHGGSDTSVPSPTNQDIRLLRENLIKKLEQAAIVELNYQIPDNDAVITPTLDIIEIIDETVNPAVGEPGSQINLSMRVKYRSQVLDRDDLINLVTPILNANTPAGYIPIDNTIMIKQIINPIIEEDGNAHWTVNAQRKLQAEIAVGKVISQINGLPIHQAMDHLKGTLPLAADAQIILFPEWWPRLPLLPTRILVLQPESK